jgi:hypothetical protein
MAGNWGYLETSEDNSSNLVYSHVISGMLPSGTILCLTSRARTPAGQAAGHRYFLRRKNHAKKTVQAGERALLSSYLKQLLALSREADREPAVAVRLIVERVCAAAEHFQYFDDLMTALDKLRPPADPARPHD